MVPCEERGEHGCRLGLCRKKPKLDAYILGSEPRKRAEQHLVPFFYWASEFRIIHHISYQFAIYFNFRTPEPKRLFPRIYFQWHFYNTFELHFAKETDLKQHIPRKKEPMYHPWWLYELPLEDLLNEAILFCNWYLTRAFQVCISAFIQVGLFESNFNISSKRLIVRPSGHDHGSHRHSSSAQNYLESRIFGRLFSLRYSKRSEVGMWFV